MVTSIRMDEELQQRLKHYAQTRKISTSLVVREAVARYLDEQQLGAHELGEHLFGRHRSADAGPSSRSEERKTRMRETMHNKHPRP
ncbi:MAG: ribbon-helix-helix protein, CopG family [Pseudomonadota bacterium]|nr:ribbon-helix-helix protein, CopG family [Pseudomonadota bacterium]